MGFRLYEVLRLYPAVPGNRKQALKDDVLPDGTVVYKGDEITFQPFCQGRHEKVWGPDAKEFKPERWISEKGDLIKMDGGKFVAFHAGPRVCLGIHTRLTFAIHCYLSSILFYA